MAQPIVVLKNVSKKIGRKQIIDDLNFEVFPGEVFGFLGPNGAGKTTTIRMILGLASLTKGEIFIDGHSIKSHFRKAISCVGGIVENPEMYKFMSGYDNLKHFARMNNISKSRIDEVVKFVGLDLRIKDKVRKYSLGMRQRLGVAQALMHKPKLLVLDEPTNGLDPAGIKELRDKLRELAKKENLAVFVSSHLLAEMELMCDRVGIIQNGKLLEIKMIDELNINVTDDKIDVILNVKPLEQAFDIIKTNFENINIEKSGIELKIHVRVDDIPSVLEALVRGGIKIFEVQQIKKSLEDKFLEMTGGNTID